MQRFEMISINPLLFILVGVNQSRWEILRWTTVENSFEKQLSEVEKLSRPLFTNMINMKLETSFSYQSSEYRE